MVCLQNYIQLSVVGGLIALAATLVARACSRFIYRGKAISPTAREGIVVVLFVLENNARFPFGEAQCALLDFATETLAKRRILARQRADRNVERHELYQARNFFDHFVVLCKIPLSFTSVLNSDVSISNNMLVLKVPKSDLLFFAALNFAINILSPRWDIKANGLRSESGFATNTLTDVSRESSAFLPSSNPAVISSLQWATILAPFFAPILASLTNTVRGIQSHGFFINYEAG